MQDDREVIEKILFGTEKMTRNDKKRTLCNIRFNLNTCKNLSAEEIYALCGTARNFFLICSSFWPEAFKLRNFVNIWMVEDRIQDLNSVTCVIFQLYFYNYLIRTKTAKYRTKINLTKRQ